MVKRLSLLILFFIFVAGFSIFLYKRGSSTSRLASTPIITPTPTPILPKVVEIVSPDMKQTLVMKEEYSGNSVTHTFIVQGEKDDTSKRIFSKTVNLSQAITIPFNTWSPQGNKYLFLKETTGEGGESYIVLTLGEPFSGGLQSIKVEDMFTRKYTEYKIADVTGWAAPTLLVVNTDNVDGSVGPSFWFDVATLSFTKLSTRFN